MSKNSLSKISYWDKKAESLGVFIHKIQAYAKFIGVREGLNPILMMNCPTQLEYGAIDVVKPENQTLVDLYKANETLCAILVLGHGKRYGMALLSKTKSEYPNGLAWEFARKNSKPNLPSGVSTVINIVVGLDQLQPKGVRNFDSKVVGVMDRS